jgi:oxygen-independent coproporphyrinogen III oxidase
MHTQTFGIYIHIPFCIQRCSYCDFATYSKDQISPNQTYVDTILLEAQKRKNLFENKKLNTVYFGGGTPSLLEAKQIGQILEGLKNLGFIFTNETEITLEVNPATMNDQKSQELSQMGVNRISIGCQSFDDDFLKICNREHNVQDTLNTITLAQKYFKNYSLDLLFSLPKQNIKQLERDLDVISSIDPPHVSAYCLTLADKHPMNQGRCSEDEQVDMFALILERFRSLNLNRYEISNFSKPNFESKHNNLYWTDADYWGLGLSAHSYKKNNSWGERFWNPSTYNEYINSINKLEVVDSIKESYSEKNYESLKQYECLTDFCHTHLRLQKGLEGSLVRQKFGDLLYQLVVKRLSGLITQGLVQNHKDQWSLTENGVLLSNQVFAEMLFSQQDIDNDQR